MDLTKIKTTLWDTVIFLNEAVDDFVVFWNLNEVLTYDEHIFVFSEARIVKWPWLSWGDV